MPTENVTTGRRLPVSERALIQRINRVLAKDGQRLRATRGERARLDFGWYWVHELSRNLCLDTHVDLESMGRELGCLKEWERLEEQT
jgi:hypothetical protein